MGYGAWPIGPASWRLARFDRLTRGIMKTFLLAGLTAGALIALGSPAMAADPAHGQQLFRAECGVCHQGGDGDGDGGAGPSLRGVVGRKVGGDPNFG
jgi:mono/diheme cytochrome c family protein